MSRFSFIAAVAILVVSVFYTQGLLIDMSKKRSKLEIDSIIEKYKKEVLEFCKKRNESPAEYIGAAFYAGYSTAVNRAREKSFKAPATRKDVVYVEDLESAIIPER